MGIRNKAIFSKKK